MFIDLPPSSSGCVVVCMHMHMHAHIYFMYQFKCAGGHVGPTVQSSPYSQTMAENYPDMPTHPHSYG